MSIGPTCPDCGFIHTRSDVQYIGSRFSAAKPARYQARHTDAPIRATRDEAERDMCQLRQEGRR